MIKGVGIAGILRLLYFPLFWNGDFRKAQSDIDRLCGRTDLMRRDCV